MTRARGVDLRARYQPRYDAGVAKHDFVVLQACYGTSQDANGQDVHDQIQPVPVRGAYLYFLSAQNWLAQVEYFLGIVEGRGYHFYALDFEKKGNTASAAFGAHAHLALQHLRDLSGKPLVLYTNPDTYQSWLVQLGHTWMKDWPLWVAQWPYYGWNEKLEEVPARPDLWQPRLPAGASAWAFWQYSADGNRRGVQNGLPLGAFGLSPSIDLNVFNGTVEELHRWVGLVLPPEPALTPFELGYSTAFREIVDFAETKLGERA